MKNIRLIVLLFATFILISSPAFSEKKNQQESVPVFTNDDLKKHSYSNSYSDWKPSENMGKDKNEAPKEREKPVVEEPPPKTVNPPPTNRIKEGVR
jgi:hypothetical protein